MKRLLLFMALVIMCSQGKAQIVAVNTDLLMDLAQTPSFGAELVIGERSTIGLNALYNKNPWGKTMRVLGVQPEYRHYFSGRPMYREFIGLGGLIATYDITWAGKVYEGLGMGLGLTFGYVFPLTKRINLDCHAGFGLMAYNHKEYYVGDKYDTDYSIDGEQRTNAKGYYILPTRIGVSITYIIK
ncbi:MAG: DUF3575 domain-containing protein [Prevotella sp.]|nr:DUF3575 domain-containing protein [Prevotella sp.]